jgi:hypothetical protein
MKKILLLITLLASPLVQAESFYWQLVNLPTTPNAKMLSVQTVDIDLFDASQGLIDKLHAANKKVICYFSAGSWENWRIDQATFPKSVKGRSNGWAGEKWVDIRSPIVLDIMKKRMDLAKSKKCDGVEPDNVDGYTNGTGFSLKAADQVTFNKALADYAHGLGLTIGLKNDISQLSKLVSSFDWALNEQCFQYNECSGYKNTFIKAGKSVFNAEYSGKTSTFCPKAKSLGIESALYALDLNGSKFQRCK